ncbi:MAG: HEAT repeat domain-containing protein [Hyphomicrobiaceae bacterium]
MDRADEIFLRVRSLGLSELIGLASADPKSDLGEAAICELQVRGGLDVLEAALALVEDNASPTRRSAGAWVLTQLGAAAGAFDHEAGKALVRLLGDPDPGVLAAACNGVGRRLKDRAVGLLLPFRDHSEAIVRFHVAIGLQQATSREAAEALLPLMRDGNRDVRDWATFGVGSILDEHDFPALREALAARLADDDAEVAMEAIAGLALRKDPRGLAALEKILARDSSEVMAGHLHACAELGEPSLLPALRALQGATATDDNAYWKSSLDDAIAACEVAGGR